EDSNNTEEEPQSDQNLQNQNFQNEENDQIVQLSKDDQEAEIVEILRLNFVLETVALFDTGADQNCILEGLIPIKYFEKTIERLSTANGDRLQIRYKLSEAVMKNVLLRIKTPFFLVKNLRNQVILGLPFIRTLFPLMMSYDGITTYTGGPPTTFQFVSTPVHRTINLLQFKANQINFLKEEVSFKTLETQLQKLEIQQK
ncbi:hypothetical protein S83_032606, partial [Arachis hypogaea]